jgi:hypothetical protein
VATPHQLQAVLCLLALAVLQLGSPVLYASLLVYRQAMVLAQFASLVALESVEVALSLFLVAQLLKTWAQV